eukprot:TRINITY_DN4878_c0_g1_i1.p1 TRINITY_DN4878_c0_g1~~TRINITY_DN4878_c0_g1_i1.p1  ORF type:complete len:225 (-),score=55.98 TRINITY_DN4878_c0_g1_i1:126-800(-)
MVKVQYAKQQFDVDLPDDATIGQIKENLEKLTGIPTVTQKLMLKGSILKNDAQTISGAGITATTKLMLVGSKIPDLIEVHSATVPESTISADKKEETKTSLSKDDAHKKIIEKGVPDEAEPGDKTKKWQLPKQLKGIMTKNGKVRLTFKSDLDELWISSSTSTQKIPYNTIRAIQSEAIEGHEDYHIMSLQVGSSEVSKYWLYFVPAQYVEAIKNEILGTFQYF